MFPYISTFRSSHGQVALVSPCRITLQTVSICRHMLLEMGQTDFLRFIGARNERRGLYNLSWERHDRAVAVDFSSWLHKEGPS